MVSNLKYETHICNVVSKKHNKNSHCESEIMEVYLYNINFSLAQ